MPSVALRGTNEPLLQHWETGFSREHGGTFSMEVKGTSLSKMSVLANNYANAGYKGNLRYQHGVATLTLNADFTAIPGGGTSPFTDITDKWEIGVDQEKPDLFQNETFLSIVQAGDDATVGFCGFNTKSSQIIAAIEASKKEPIILDEDGVATETRGVSPWQSFYSKMQYGKLHSAAGVPGEAVLVTGINLLGAHPNLHDFVMDYFENRTNFLRGKYVVRHHTNAPSTYASNVADFSVEKIYTVAQLLSECQSSALWVLPMPGYLAYKINSYPVPTYLRGNYIWGALKTRSSATTAARGRVEIVTEYLLDGWPIHTYGLKT